MIFLRNDVSNRTCGSESQYRCRRVGMGVQTPINTPTSPPHTRKHPKRSFFHFSTRVHGWTDERLDRQIYFGDLAIKKRFN